MPTAIVLPAGATRTPLPLNIVGETTHVLVDARDSQATMACFHLVAPPMEQLVALDAEYGLTTMGPPMGPGDQP
ncbi:hypothetical protein [Gemmatimonas sp.]|uniref:hypothetical protein n=1 Tax=Gemmatimonas sp. TaxID=1962908 RepID=UPI0022CA4909|nr:hypothetical protein [Gemmatimonas sp.]MCZ8205921.1 hypothetical protein [Gemmatimonas sp.]